MRGVVWVLLTCLGVDAIDMQVLIKSHEKILFQMRKAPVDSVLPLWIKWSQKNLSKPGLDTANLGLWELSFGFPEWQKNCQMLKGDSLRLRTFVRALNSSFPDRVLPFRQMGQKWKPLNWTAEDSIEFRSMLVDKLGRISVAKQSKNSSVLVGVSISAGIAADQGMLFGYGPKRMFLLTPGDSSVYEPSLTPLNCVYADKTQRVALLPSPYPRRSNFNLIALGVDSVVAESPMGPWRLSGVHARSMVQVGLDTLSLESYPVYEIPIRQSWDAQMLANLKLDALPAFAGRALPSACENRARLYALLGVFEFDFSQVDSLKAQIPRANQLLKLEPFLIGDDELLNFRSHLFAQASKIQQILHSRRLGPNINAQMLWMLWKVGFWSGALDAEALELYDKRELLGAEALLSLSEILAAMNQKRQAGVCVDRISGGKAKFSKNISSKHALALELESLMSSNLKANRMDDLYKSLTRLSDEQGAVNDPFIQGIVGRYSRDFMAQKK